VEERRGAYRVLWGNLRERGHLEDPGVDWRIILRRIFRKWDGGIDSIVLAQDMGGGGSCEYGNETSGSL
jgi:hypothetical protein